MRRFMIFVIALAMIIGAGWYAASSFMTREVARLVSTQPQIDAAEITPIRKPQWIGTVLRDAKLSQDQMDLRIPQLQLRVPLTRPNEAQVQFTELELTQGARQHLLQSSDTVARVRIAPMNDMAISLVKFLGHDLMLDGQKLAPLADLALELDNLGLGAPKAARSAYNLSAQLDGLALPVLAQLGSVAAPDAPEVTLNAQAQLWFDSVLSPERLQSPEAPRLLGLQSNGTTIKLRDMTLRIVGRVDADDQDRASGQIAIYTKDAHPILDMLVETGVVPPKSVGFIQNLLREYARVSSDITAGATEGIAGLPGMPLPGENELRIVLNFRGGMMRVGPLPIGPAPRLNPALSF